jgi:hypothetical protein
MVILLWWCWCSDVIVLMFLWQCYCDDDVLFMLWCGGVFLLKWCFVVIVKWWYCCADVVEAILLE